MSTPLCFALAGDFHRNSRARRQVLALADAGIDVRVLHLPSGNSLDRSLPPTRGNVAFETVHSAFLQSSGPGRFIRLHSDFAAALNHLRPAALHASDLFVLPALTRAARQSGIRLSFDSRELYAHTVGTVGKPWARAAWHLVQKRHLPTTDFSFTVSDGIADLLAATYRIPRPIVIPNVPLHAAAAVGPDIRSTLGLPADTFLAVQPGAVRPLRGCETAVEAVARIPEAHLAFVGDGPHRQALAALAERLGDPQRIHFVDPVPAESVPTFLRTADVGLVLLPDICLSYHLALPNKLFECIAAGVPVVVSDLPEMRRVALDHGVGLCVEPSDVDAAAAAIGDLASNRVRLAGLRKNCRSAANVLTWENWRQRFVQPFLQERTV